MRKQFLAGVVLLSFSALAAVAQPTSRVDRYEASSRSHSCASTVPEGSPVWDAPSASWTADTGTQHARHPLSENAICWREWTTLPDAAIQETFLNRASPRLKQNATQATRSLSRSPLIDTGRG
mgnify:FL=1